MLEWKKFPMDFVKRVTSLSYYDALLFIIGAGLATHLIFKRTETHQPLHLVILLIGFPAALTYPLVHSSSSVIAAITVTFSTFWTTLGASIVAYRLSPWHPLAKYPGPAICKISKLWFAILSLQGKQHIHYAQLHEKYGDVVRVGPNELSFRNIEAVAPVLGPHGLPKGPFWDGRLPEEQVVRPLIALRDKTEHTRRRRPWTRAFNTAALKGYETFITGRCLQLIEVLGRQKGVTNIAQWVSYFTYDIMGDFAFGGGTEMMRDGDVDGLWHLLEAGQKNAIFMSHVPWLGALFLRFPNFATDLKAFRKNARERALMRKKRGSTHKDLYHHLIDEDGISQNPPTLLEIISDGGLAIVAGSDTTSTAISNLFYFLMCNPTSYKRLQVEVDELGDEIMDFTKQAHMRYLNASINESLRLFPPVLSGSQRYVDTGREIGSYYVPKGTSVFTPFYSLHRDPRYFSPFPNSFLPERWLSPSDQLSLEPSIFKDQASTILNQDAFIPFSTGPSNCVGKNLAWLEMRMLVCLTLQKFDIRFKDGYDPAQWEADMLDYFVILRGELPVVLTPRN